MFKFIVLSFLLSTQAFGSITQRGLLFGECEILNHGNAIIYIDNGIFYGQFLKGHVLFQPKNDAEKWNESVLYQLNNYGIEIEIKYTKTDNAKWYAPKTASTYIKIIKQEIYFDFEDSTYQILLKDLKFGISEHEIFATQLNKKDLTPIKNGNKKPFVVRVNCNFKEMKDVLNLFRS